MLIGLKQGESTLETGIKRILRSGISWRTGKSTTTPPPPLHSKLSVLPAADPRLPQVYIPPGHLHVEVCHPVEHGSQ